MNFYAPGTNTTPCGSIIINGTPIINGTNGYFLYDNNGIIGEQPGGGALTIGVSPISGGTANYALTVDPTGTVLADMPVRTVLTGNTTYTVKLAGGDFTEGQDAMDFISSSIDTGGFIVTIEYDAGTWAGIAGKPIVGGGVLEIKGQGVASTTIQNNPIGNLPYGFGEPIALYILIGAVVYAHDLTVDASNVNGPSQAVYVGPGNQFWAADPVNFFSGNINFFTNNSQPDIYCINAFYSFFSDSEGSGSITITGNWSGYLTIGPGEAQIGSQYTLTGNTWSQEFLNVYGPTDCEVYAVFSGSSSGSQGQVVGPGILYTFGAGTSYLPGTPNTVTTSLGGQYA